MSYPLQAMLKIRITREDRAATELTHARRERDTAERTRDEKQEKLRKFEETKEERRDRVFATVLGRTVTRDDLDQTREAVQSIDEEGLLLAEDERKAEAVLEEKTREAQSAKVRYVAAGKNREKIEIHRASWEDEDRRERERAEDLELEEFTGRKTEEEEDA